MRQPELTLSFYDQKSQTAPSLNRNCWDPDEKDGQPLIAPSLPDFSYA